MVYVCEGKLGPAELREGSSPCGRGHILIDLICNLSLIRLIIGIIFAVVTIQILWKNIRRLNVEFEVA